MACIGCEEYAKRVTNVYRDEELKEKYASLIGYEVLCDCFICDNCNTKLQQALTFRESCVKIYKKNNPNAIKTHIHKTPSSTHPPPFHSTAIEGNKEEYFIIENNDDVLLNDDDMSQNQFVQIEQTTGTIDDGGEYSIFEIEETPKVATRSIKKSPAKQRKRKREYAEISNDSIEQKEESIKEESKGGGRKSYSLQQKLEIIEYSEKNSNRDASRHFSLNESTVRCFRRQKESLLKMSPTKSTNRHGTPHWPELELKLKEWTEQQRKKPKINEIKDQAVKIASELNIANFIGSTSWTFKFMQRNNIHSSQPRPRKHTLNTEIDD